MRRRRCQRLLKVLRWDIITLMALLEQLVLPAEDPSFTRFSFFWTGESPRYGLQPLYFLRTAGGPAPPSGFYWILSVEWTLVSPSPQQFTWPEYMQIICCFSYSSACWGRTWCIYRYVGVDTSWSSGSVMMNMMKLDWFINTTQVVYEKPFSLDWSETHGSVHEYGRGLISLRGRGGNIFSPSLSLQENNA